MRTLAWFALVLAVGYAAVAAAVALSQGRLIYPSAGRTAAPSAAAVAARGLEAVPADGAPRAFVAEPPGEARATAVVFHGNAGTALDRGYYVRALSARGVRVVLAEYPGYGGRPGAPSEAALVADGAGTVRWAARRYPGPLVVWGESLGAGVAAAVAARVPALVDGVVLLTPWDSLLARARQSYGWLPVGLLLRDRYDSAAHLRGSDRPVAVVVAERDAVIPPERAHALFDALEGPKRLWTFPGAGHNSWPADPGAGWWDEVLSFALGLEGDGPRR